MQRHDSNPFPSARSPLCAIPTNPDDRDARATCAIETIRNACNLLDVLAHALEDSEAPEAAGQWTLLNTAQWAIAHALQLLEEEREPPHRDNRDGAFLLGLASNRRGEDCTT